MGLLRPLVVMAVALWAVGCAWKGPTPAKAMGEMETSWEVMVLDEACYRAVGLQGLRAKQTPHGILVVRVELGNRTDGDHDVQLRVLFGDERGHLVGEDPPWEDVMVPRVSYVIYEAHSMAPASTYRVELRSP
jgi:hypothetical protein